MGDPKRFTNKFSKPSHPWNKVRIDKERELKKTYGLVNKKELWKMNSVLENYKERTKSLTKRTGEQAEKEKAELLGVMNKFGLIKEGTPDEILGLEIESVLDRRLQTLLVKRKLARTAKQARQMITHGHVLIDGKKITSPSRLVSVDDESKIGFLTKSPFVSESHPERAIEAKEIKEEKKQVKIEVAPPIDPEEAKVDPVKATQNEESLVESLNKEEKEVLEKKPETVTEKIEEDIKEENEVAEGKPEETGDVVDTHEKKKDETPLEVETKEEAKDNE